MDGLCLNILLLKLSTYIERNTLVFRTRYACTSDAIHLYFGRDTLKNKLKKATVHARFAGH